MKEQSDITEMLGEWRRLTLEEGAAINKNDWARVTAHQTHKLLLQQEITQAIKNQPSPEAAGLAGHEVVRELLTLEAGNQARLDSLCEEKREAIKRAKLTSHDLRGVRRAYGNFSQSNWESYS